MLVFPLRLPFLEKKAKLPIKGNSAFYLRQSALEYIKRTDVPPVPIAVGLWALGAPF
jgi:hypothetical protein